MKYQIGCERSKIGFERYICRILYFAINVNEGCTLSRHYRPGPVS